MGSVIILGGGVSGLVAAKLMAAAGRQTMLIEPRSWLGGNQISRRCGDYTFDIGAFMLFASSPFFRHFPAALATCLDKAFKSERITPAGTLSAYPYSIKRDLLDKGVVEIAAATASLFKGRLLNRRADTAASFARYHLGGRLFRNSGLAFYIERLCGLPADQVDYRFAEKRMGWVARETKPSAIVRRLRRSNGASAPRVDSIARPAEGFKAMFDVVADELLQAGVVVRTGLPVTSVSRQADGSFRVSQGDRHFDAMQVISTLPLDMTAKLCGLDVAVPPPMLTLLSLYLTHEGDLGFASDFLYNFAGDGSWKRLTVHSRIYGRRNGRDYLSVEIPFRADRHGQSVEQELQTFLAFMRARGLMSGEVELVGHDLTENAYPVYGMGSIAETGRLMASIEGFGIDLVGRQARFDYIPTASEATRLAEAAIAHTLRKELVAA